MPHSLPLINTMAMAFVAAWVLGLLTQKFKLSPIVGYLLAGICIGPYTPGVKGDPTIAPQLAELGVILLMFGVGLHFHLKDLLAVRKVALPGALGQSLAATLLGVVVAHFFGMPFRAGLVLGMAMAVASTVVLIRVLTDHKMLNTVHGHVAVGWLIVEDVLTVVVLVLIPALGTVAVVEGHDLPESTSLWISLPIALLKLAAMVLILLVAGSKIIPWIMVKVARLRSRELFTLTVLVMAIGVTAGSYYIFGASMALGAFLAGMVVGQSPVSQQAGADALPMRDAFAVLFFTSVGMLFDPMFIWNEPLLTLAGLGIVMIGKPVAALTIVAVIGYPIRTGLTVALALAQIGEFSFILGDLGRSYNILDADSYNLLVACSIISITLNPLIFKQMDNIEAALKRSPRLWNLLNRNAHKRELEVNQLTTEAVTASDAPLAVILGYGPVGQTVDQLLRREGVETLVVDLNMNTIERLRQEGRTAIYGDAYNIEVMGQALPRATQLVITLPHATNRNPLIVLAKLLNPDVKVYVRAHYLAEEEELRRVGADAVCYEEEEAAIALSSRVMLDYGMAAPAVSEEAERLRKQFRRERRQEN